MNTYEKIADRAFPTVAGGSKGMTLRDWFAGQVLVGIMETCKNDTRNEGETHEQMFARKSYQVADAMLEARKGIK
jgi:hypothetical protein